MKLKQVTIAVGIVQGILAAIYLRNGISNSDQMAYISAAVFGTCSIVTILFGGR
jgi:membrane-associated PAP2 superfamily phosphatase